MGNEHTTHAPTPVANIAFPNHVFECDFSDEPIDRDEDIEALLKSTASQLQSP